MARYETADYSVPHCKHEKTAEGFVVTFRRRPVWLDDIDPVRQAGSIIGILLFVGPFAIGLVVWAIRVILQPSRIEVTKDAVIINGKMLRRADFGGFVIDHTRKPTPGRVGETVGDNAVLAYRYGRQKQKMSELWTHDEALEFTSALNQEINAMPIQGAEHRPSPDQLRSGVRSTDF